MKSIIYSAVFFISSSSLLSAQSIGPQTLNAAGNSISLAGNTYEWSVGEMVLINTATVGNLTVTQGVLQPLIIEEDTTGISNKETKLTQSQLHIFPNPTENIIYLKPNLQPNTNLSITIMDIQSRVLLKKEIFLNNGNEQQEINLSGMAAGMYMLNVFAKEPNREFFNSYKINKVQ